MTNKSNHGFGGSTPDSERAKLRGKGKEPEYRTGADDDRNFVDDKGLRGENAGLRGHPLDSGLDERLRIKPEPPRGLR